MEMGRERCGMMLKQRISNCRRLASYSRRRLELGGGTKVNRDGLCFSLFCPLVEWKMDVPSYLRLGGPS